MSDLEQELRESLHWAIAALGIIEDDLHSEYWLEQYAKAQELLKRTKPDG